MKFFKIKLDARANTLIAIAFTLIIFTNKPNVNADQPYVDKSYIDSTIQAAFYNINNATTIAGMGMPMEKAIEHAKQVVVRLKNLVNENPNGKYILWKVAELESQIYLEENGLLLEKQEKKKKIVYDCIVPFNTELGKPRPDFSALYKIQNKVWGIEDKVVDEMQSSLVNRKKNISTEAIASLQKALENSNYDLARQELVYIKINQEFLEVSLTQYSMLAAQVQSKLTVDSERKFLSDYSKRIEDMLKVTKLGDAKAMLVVTNDRVNSLKGLVISKEWDKFYFRNKKLSDMLYYKEDSLVNNGMFLLNEQGIITANDFMDNVVKKAGVTGEKIGKLELAILERAMANRKLQDTTVVKQLASITQPLAFDDTTTLFSDMLSIAKAKAKTKADSIEAFKATNVHRTQSEEIRYTNMKRAEESKTKRDQEMQKQNTEKANKFLVTIYTLLEKKNVKKAYEEYMGHQTFLARYVPAQPFSKLDSVVTYRYGSLNSNKK